MAPRLVNLTLDLDKIPIGESNLPELLTNGPPLRKLKLSNIDFKGTDLRVLAGLASHSTL